MRSIRLNLPSVILAVGCLALVAYQAGARRPASMPTSVASVNLSAVLNGLNERAVKQSDYGAMLAGVEEEEKGKASYIEALKKRYDEIPATDVAARRSARNELELAMFEYQGWKQFKLDELDVEKALLLKDMYRNIQAAIAAVCQAQGYDFVIVDDSLDQIVWNPQAQVSREVQLKQQLNTRRLIYANPALDITNDIIARMNNAFNAKS